MSSLLILFYDFGKSLSNSLSIPNLEAIMASTHALTLNRLGFLQIGMAREGQILPPPLCNFCLNGSVDLKFGMQIVLGKIYRCIYKNCQEVAQNADISIF